MIGFIDEQRQAYGVEPICKVLPIAPSTYHAHAAGRRDPARLSARARRDGVLKTEIDRVFKDNFGVCGVRKVWRQMKREGFEVARCTAAWLMKAQGLQGVILHVPEYGRTYDDNRKGALWTKRDFQAIALGHEAMRAAIAPEAGYLLFEDTDPLLTRVWEEYLLGEAPSDELRLLLAVPTANRI
jgi:hypothetical protein